MAPDTRPFPVSALPDRTNLTSKNFGPEKRRKGPPVELAECALLEMVQYSCNPPDEEVPPRGLIRCKPLVRLFRRFVLSFLFLAEVMLWVGRLMSRCAGGLMVETTTWEGARIAEEKGR